MSTVILLALVLITGLMIVISWRPDDFRVTRSASIDAPPEAVFAHINDLHKWDAWSPWAKLDPNAKNSFEGTPQGVGASMSWVGNSKVGVGRMTITESIPGELVRMRLEFEKPMKAVNQAEFKLRPQGTGTEVVWSMSGRSEFVAKAIGLFMSCDKMVGGQFEKGLASLKAVAEAGADQSPL